MPEPITSSETKNDGWSDSDSKRIVPLIRSEPIPLVTIFIHNVKNCEKYANFLKESFRLYDIRLVGSKCRHTGAMGDVTYAMANVLCGFHPNGKGKKRWIIYYEPDRYSYWVGFDRYRYWQAPFFA